MTLALCTRIFVAAISISCFFLLGETIPTEEFVRFNFILALFSLSALLSNFGGIQVMSRLVIAEVYDENVTAMFLAFRTAAFSFIIIFVYLFITKENLIFSFYGFMFTFCFSFLEALRLFKNYKLNSIKILLMTIYGRSLIIAVLPTILVLVSHYYPIKLEAESLVFVLTVGLIILSVFHINNLDKCVSRTNKYLAMLRPNLSQFAAFLLSSIGSAVVFVEQIAVYELLLPEESKLYLYALKIFGLVSLIIAPITFYYQPKLKQSATFNLRQYPVLIYISIIQVFVGLSFFIISKTDFFHRLFLNFIDEDMFIIAGVLGVLLSIRSLEALSAISSIRIYLINSHLEAAVMIFPCLCLSSMLCLYFGVDNIYHLATLSSITVLLLHIINVYFGSRDEI